MKTAAARRDPFAVQAARLIALASAEVKGGFAGAPSQPRGALEWWQAKNVVSAEEWKQLSEQARQRAFMVSQVVPLELVRQVHTAIGKAIADGTGFEEFKAGLRDKLKLPEGRLETIWRTNIQQALGAGRQLRQRHPDVLESHPFWRFIAVDDSRTSVVCKLCRNVILRHDHPWWRTHQPPLHHRCRSTIQALREVDARKKGITAKAPAAPPAKGFGAELDLSDYEPDLTSYPPDLAKAFVEKKKRLEAEQPKEEPTQAEEVLPGPAAKPPSEFVTLPADAPKLAAVAKKTLATIDEVHGVIEVSDVDIVEVVPAGPSDTVGGRYVPPHFSPTGRAQIQVRAGVPTPRIAVVHEFGHHVDFAGLGKGVAEATLTVPELQPFLEAARRSTAVERLVEVFASKSVLVGSRRIRVAPGFRELARYLLRPTELFARAYAQWVALRSGDTDLRREIEQKRRHRTHALLPEHWTDDDFAPIVEALDRLMEARGWTRKRPSSKPPSGPPPTRQKKTGKK